MIVIDYYIAHIKSIPDCYIPYQNLFHYAIHSTWHLQTHIQISYNQLYIRIPILLLNTFSFFYYIVMSLINNNQKSIISVPIS